jgi:DNA-binding CsgD family transcriptional regulator
MTTRLSPQQRAVMRLVSEGMPNNEVAATLGIGIETVHSHLKMVFLKLGVHNRVQAVNRFRSLS